MADLLRPGVRTFKPRRSRISTRAQVALVEQAHHLLRVGNQPLDLSEVWPERPPVVLEIGFGMGTSTAEMAAADPGTAIVAIEVHTPGVGNLLHLVGAQGLTNVRVMEGDALYVLARMVPPKSLTGVRTFFPDPWPKARHAKRRLVQPAVLDAVHACLIEGGLWQLATDDTAYAERALDAFTADPRWSGGVIARPADRPITGYERRALDAGRTVTDIAFRAR